MATITIAKAMMMMKIIIIIITDPRTTAETANNKRDAENCTDGK